MAPRSHKSLSDSAPPRRTLLAITALVVLVTALAAAGLSRLSFSDDPRDLYSRDDATGRELERAEAAFGSDDNLLAIVVQGDRLLTRDGLSRLRRFAESLDEHPRVAEVRSLLDARHAVEFANRTLYLPIVPYEGQPIGDLASVRHELLNHPLLVGRSLSDDGETTLVVCRIGETVADSAGVAGVIDQVRSLGERAFSGSTLGARVTGPAALRIDTFHRLKRDLALFCLLGSLVIFAIGFAVFRRLQPVLIATLGPAMGVFWTLGLMGWTGQRLDGMNCLLPTLLFAIGFTDAMYLITAIAKRRRSGVAAQTAVRAGLKEVGRACLLTSLTTAIGFLALTVTTIGSLQRFGLFAAIGVFLVFSAVLTITPLLSVAPWFSRLPTGQKFGQVNKRHRERSLLRLSSWVASRPAMLSLGSLVVFALLASASRQVPFDMRWSEALNQSGETAAAAHQLDNEFGGSVPAKIIVGWPIDTDSDTIIEYLSDLHTRLERFSDARGDQPVRLGKPFSLLTVLESLRTPGEKLSSLIRLVRQRSPELFNRLVQPSQRELLITLPLPDAGARRLLPAFEAVEHELIRLSQKHRGFTAHLTGSTVVSARNLTSVLFELIRGLSLAAVLAFVVLWIGFRSLHLALVSMLPNSMPLLIALVALLVLDQPMQVTVALTLCLSLGLAVDDTIHFITRFRTDRQAGKTAASACRHAYRSVGGAMVVTTGVMVAALATTITSGSPAIQLFGVLSCLTLLAALVGDLVSLPALLMLVTDEPKSRKRSATALSRQRPAAAAVLGG